MSNLPDNNVLNAVHVLDTIMCVSVQNARLLSTKTPLYSFILCDQIEIISSG